MRSTSGRILAIIIAMLMIIGMIPLKASAASASELAAQINAISGLFADAVGSTLTVTGTNTNVSTPLTLNIDSGVTVNWEATYTGAVSPASASMITVSGSGTFDVRSAGANIGAIINNGTGNTLNITGAGTTLKVFNSGTVQSSRSGSAVLVSANNVEVDVGSLGTIISLDGNVNAALQIGGGADILGTRVNIDGGSVISVGTGFAINDGAGTALVNNDTVITITTGVVTAGGNSAIHSTGINTTVSVSGGIVSNAAGNNLNPTIDMQGDMNAAAPPGYNITISGNATVQSTSTNGYTLQTKGNVLIASDAHIVAINGRAINLVGLDSVASVKGGIVETLGSGTAISTATTNVETVQRASVDVLGGTVTSVSGYAINITGVSSKVTVGGDAVVSTTSASNHAINATGANTTIEIGGDAVVSATATDAIHTTSASGNAVTVGGNAKVSSTTGRAIYASGAGSAVTVDDTCQIWVWNTGNAIYCSRGTVTVNSGFVFTYGNNPANVINAASFSYAHGVALVSTWYKSVGSENWIYLEGSQTSANDLNVLYMPDTMRIRWVNEPAFGGGISYSIGPNEYYFPIAEVSVYETYGLIFKADTGEMFRNVDGTGDLNLLNSFPYGNGRGELWDAIQSTPGDPFTLVLNGFSWVTNLTVTAPSTDPPAVPAALTIIGDTAILINGDSSFESTNPDGGTGIRFGQSTDVGDEVITFQGSNTLTAIGRNSPGIGIDIREGSLIIDDGVFIAQAGRAVNWAGPDPEPGRIIADPHTLDYIWTFSKNFDGSGGTTGYGASTPFDLFSTDKFVMFRTVVPVSLTGASQMGGISHIADSVAIRLTFSSDVSGLTEDDITIINGTGQAVKGMLSGSGTTWTLILNRVDAEGLVNIQVNKYFDDFYLAVNERNNVPIYKADTQRFNVTLSNTVEPGGDMEKLFEYEIIFDDDPRNPQPISFATSQIDVNTFYVTYANGSPFPANRITGANNNVLLLKHGETVIIHNFPPGDFYLLEHSNVGYLTAFDINNEGWFTAPNGESRIFTLTSDIVINSFNSIVPEVPGAPERPFDPQNPSVPPVPPGTEKSPQTGITRSYMIPGFMLALGMLLITGAELYKRRAKKVSGGRFF